MTSLIGARQAGAVHVDLAHVDGVRGVGVGAGVVDVRALATNMLTLVSRIRIPRGRVPAGVGHPMNDPHHDRGEDDEGPEQLAGIVEGGHAKKDQPGAPIRIRTSP